VTPLLFPLLLDDIIGGMVEVIVEVVAEVVFAEVVLIALFYTPGFAALKPMTIGQYPPGFYAETGKIPCYLLGVTIWVGTLFVLFGM